MKRNITILLLIKWAFLLSAEAHAYTYNFDTKTMSTDFLTRDTTYADIKKLPIPRKDLWTNGLYEGCMLKSILWPDTPEQITIVWGLPKETIKCRKLVIGYDKPAPSAPPVNIPLDNKINFLELRPEVVSCELEDSTDNCTYGPKKPPEPCKIPQNSKAWTIDRRIALGTSLHDIATRYGDDIIFYGFSSEGGGGCCEGKSVPKSLSFELWPYDVDAKYIDLIFQDVRGSKTPPSNRISFKKIPPKLGDQLTVYDITIELNVFNPEGESEAPPRLALSRTSPRVVTRWRFRA